MTKDEVYNIPTWFWVLTAAYLLHNHDPSMSLKQLYYRYVEEVLIPLYTVWALAYIAAMIIRRNVLPKLKERRLNREKQEREAARAKEEEEKAEAEGGDDTTEEQPVDLTGRYKLVSIENFDAFLAVQGVPWALRKAACKARPIHRITHRGNRVTIKIEGIINTQTTYTIGGPPVRIDIRGRAFDDSMAYLENGKGIRGTKKAIEENYTVIVERVLSEDKKKIVLTGRAEFTDDRENIESVQIFERVEE